MGLIERIKSVLGLGTSASPSQPGTATGDRQSAADDAGTGRETAPGSDSREHGQAETSGSGDEVDVTVEHEPEPDTESEDAVKGTDTAATTDTDTAATTDTDTAATTDTGTDAGSDADLEDIKGIGSTYAERLREAGVEGVDDLAAADAADLAEASGIAESRIEKWIDRAGTR